MFLKVVVPGKATFLGEVMSSVVNKSMSVASKVCPRSLALLLWTGRAKVDTSGLHGIWSMVSSVLNLTLVDLFTSRSVFQSSSSKLKASVPILSCVPRVLNEASERSTEVTDLSAPESTRKACLLKPRLANDRK